MPGDWSYEQTRSLVGVWSQTNVQGERDGVTRNPVIFECITQRGKWERWRVLEEAVPPEDQKADA